MGSTKITTKENSRQAAMCQVQKSSLFRLKLAKGLQERFIQEDDTDRICEAIYRTGEELGWNNDKYNI